MSDSAVVIRGTGRTDSDVVELVTQVNKGGQYWILSSPALGVATAAATFSLDKFYIAGTNKVYQQATATGGGFTAITLATGNYLLVGAYRTVAGTLGLAAGTAGATIGAATMPTVPATAHAYGLILLSTTGASGFTGGTTELDGTNANAVFFNLLGAAPFAVSTSPITTVPG